ncbi:MAG: TonB-dependent receptor [Croceibacterium sp.]
MRTAATGSAKSKTQLLATCCATALLLGPGVARAQEANKGSEDLAQGGAETNAGAPATARDAISEIVVTANKRRENMQKAAISISVLGGDQLAQLNVIDPGQLAGIKPGIQFQQSFTLLTYIRGIGNYTVQPATDQSIAYNVDGNYISRQYGMPDVLFDLERIELVRGPQGTLQGRNAIGGSVNLVTNKPTDRFEGKFSATLGNYGQITTEGMINMPLGDNAALRVSAASNNRDGYVGDGFMDSNIQGVRARLKLDPAPNLDILLTAEYTRRNEKGPGYSICPPGSLDAACKGVQWKPWGGFPGQDTNNAIGIDEPNYVRSDNRTVYAEANLDLGFATLTWTPSYRFDYYRNHTTFSHYFGFAPAARDQLFQQELRLVSAPTSKISWVAGVYYGRQQSREQNYFTIAIPPYITTNTPGFPELGHVNFKNDIDKYVYRSMAAFAQVLVPLTPQFRVMLGGRFTQDKKTENAHTGLVYPGPTLARLATHAELQNDKFTYKLGVEFDAAPDVMLYANYSTGFKAGGVNGVPNAKVLPITFEPETIKAFQGGIKSRFLGGRLQINGEAFHYDLRGFQTVGLAFDPSTGILFGGTINSQSAELYGGELELTARLSSDDQVDAAVTYLHARHTRFELPTAGLSLSGKPMSNAPPFTFTGNYTHTFHLENGLINLHLMTRFEDAEWVDFRLQPGAFQKAFWRHSADITYTSQAGWSLGAFVQNITNNGALLHSVPGAILGQYTLGLAYPPRTFGVRATAKL